MVPEFDECARVVAYENMRFFHAIIALLVPVISQAGDMVTLKSFTSNVSDPLVLAEGEGARLLSSSARGTTSVPATLQITFENDPNVLVIDLSETSFSGFALEGPASIVYRKPYNVARAFATFDVTRPIAPILNAPVASVVIPEDASGQFQVLLESSTDAVTWELAQPGSYGGGTVKQFFRARIVRTN